MGSERAVGEPIWCVCVRVCVHACVRVCVRACMHVCVWATVLELLWLLLVFEDRNHTLRTKAHFTTTIGKNILMLQQATLIKDS